MKSIHRIIAAVFAIAALALVAPTMAQSQNLQYIGVPGGTLNIAATSTNTTMSATNGMVVGIRSLNYSAFQPTFALTGSGTSACVFTFDTSIDGSVWSAGAFTISVTANGTNKVATVSNQTTGSIPYVRLAGVTNPNSTAITNLYVAVTSKTSP
jgi:hypothetical protein